MIVPAFLTRSRVPGLHFLILDTRRDLYAPTQNGMTPPAGGTPESAVARAEESRERRDHASPGMWRLSPAFDAAGADRFDPGRVGRRNRRSQNGISSSGPPPKSLAIGSSAPAGTAAS